MTKKKEEQPTIEPKQDILSGLMQETEPLSQRIIYETSKQLFDIEKIRMICDLSPDQINYFFKLTILDELFYQHYARKDKLKFNDLFNKLLQFTISKRRQSRQEIVDMFKILRVESESETKKGLFHR